MNHTSTIKGVTMKLIKVCLILLSSVFASNSFAYGSPFGSMNPNNPFSDVSSPFGSLNPNNPFSEVSSPFGKYNPNNPFSEGIHPTQRSGW